MKHIRHFCLLAFFALMLAQSAPVDAQRVTDSGYRTVAHIKSDGTIQDAGYHTIGHIKKDGTVQNASYHTIGHAPDIPLAWTAFFFFFRE